MVFNGRAAGTYKSVHGGVTFFTEEGLNDTRFTVFGLDFAQSLPRGGRWRLDLPFSHGTPNVASSVDSRPVSAGADTDGFAIQGEVEQPFAFWSGVLHASFLHADDNFSNPFSATITPGAGYFNANAALVPAQAVARHLRRHLRALQHHHRRCLAHDAVRRMGRDDRAEAHAQGRLRRTLAGSERLGSRFRTLHRASNRQGRRSLRGPCRARAERARRHRPDVPGPDAARRALEDDEGYVALLHAAHLRLGDRADRRFCDDGILAAQHQGRAERRR